MEHENLNIIDKFFEAYSRRDTNDIQQVLSENVKWLFPGQNSLSGEKVGIEEVISFFDKMGNIMGKSNVEVKRLIIGANNDYVIECQQIRTNRKDGVNFNQDMCVLWSFEGRRIIQGKHFMSDQYEADTFFK